MIEFIQANATWLVLPALFLLMMRMHGGSGMGGGGGHQHDTDRHNPRPHVDRGTLATIARDPVCDMLVDPRTAAATIEHNGRSYYFCSTECKGVFEKHPDKFGQDQGTGHDHRMLAGG